MYKILSKSILLVAIGIFATGSQVKQESIAFKPITFPGTGDSQDLLRMVAKDYEKQYPQRSVEVPDSIGSGGGIELVGKGMSEIGRVARLPNPKELEKYGSFKYLEFARVPVAFVISGDTGVKNLNKQQICDIYSGKIDNWEQVGGNDLEIEVQARPDDDSNMQVLRRQVACFKDLKVIDKANPNLYNNDLVNSMQNFDGAIGFMPLGEAILNEFQTITIEGKSPSDPSYKIDVGLGFVYKESLSPSIEAFVDFLRTPFVNQLMKETGYVPVKLSVKKIQ